MTVKNTEKMFANECKRSLLSFLPHNKNHFMQRYKT